MKTFILMTKLAPEVTTRMKDRASIGRAWLEQVKPALLERRAEPA